jgi:hypothetical protein
MASSKSAAPSAPFEPPRNPAQLLSIADVAKWIGVHPTTVRRLGIPRIVLGRRLVRLRAGDVQKFLDAKEQKQQKNTKRRRA